MLAPLLAILVAAAGTSAAEDRVRVETGFSAGELAANAFLLELFPRRPWTIAARYQSAVLRGQLHHVVSARAGASVLGAGFYAGYGAFLSPQGGSHGPEAGLAYWF